jgi:hypothetical protein
MYKLILILTFVANGASVEVEEFEFDDKSSCQEALIEILNGYEKDPGGIMSRLHVQGFCVAKGDD